MADLEHMPRPAMQQAIAAITAAEDEAVRDWKDFTGSLPKRMNAAQRERAAYLHGRIAGLHSALREFEKRIPLQLVGGKAEA